MKHILFIVCLLFTFTLHSQGQKEKTSKNSDLIVRMHILNPGIAFERIMAVNSTVTFDLRIGTAFHSGEHLYEIDFTEYYIFFVPQLRAEYRHYTSLEKRMSLGKRTDYLSSGYWGIQAYAGFIAVDVYSSLGVVYGFQQTFGRRCYIDIAIGPGIGSYMALERSFFSVTGNLSLGFILD